MPATSPTLPRLLLFSAHVRETMLDAAIDLPGWSHAGQSRVDSLTRHPSDEAFRRIFFFARHRRQAAAHVARFCGQARDLDDGKRCDGLIADCHRRAFKDDN